MNPVNPMNSLNPPPADRWSAVDSLLNEQLLGPDPVLDAALEASRAAGLPAINVMPSQGKLLQLLARLQHARTILEIGTLAGYSTIWLARAVPPDGRVVTIEFDQKHADVARANFERAGLTARIDLRIGAALDVLPQLQREGAGPFDLVFIDADKPRTPQYIEWAIRLARPGTLLIVDNVVRDGELANAASTDDSVQGMRRSVELLASDGRLDATVIQTVGGKGYDGFALAIIGDPGSAAAGSR